MMRRRYGLAQERAAALRAPDQERGGAGCEPWWTTWRDLSMFPLQVRLRNRCGNAEEGPHPMRTFLIS